MPNKEDRRNKLEKQRSAEMRKWKQMHNKNPITEDSEQIIPNISTTVWWNICSKKPPHNQPIT